MKQTRLFLYFLLPFVSRTHRAIHTDCTVNYMYDEKRQANSTVVIHSWQQFQYRLSLNLVIRRPQHGVCYFVTAMYVHNCSYVLKSESTVVTVFTGKEMILHPTVIKTAKRICTEFQFRPRYSENTQNKIKSYNVIYCLNER